MKLHDKKQSVAHKMFHAMNNDEKTKHVNAGTGRKLTKAEQAWKTKDWPKAEKKDYSMTAQSQRHEENRAFQNRNRRAWND